MSDGKVYDLDGPGRRTGVSYEVAPIGIANNPRDSVDSQHSIPTDPKSETDGQLIK